MTLAAVALLLAAGTATAAQPEPTSDALREARDATRAAQRDAEVALPPRPATTAPIPRATAATAEPPRPMGPPRFSIEAALRDAGVNVDPPTALPENTVLSRRAGVVIPVTEDALLFVPDPAGRVPGEGPMVIAPTANLERLKASLAEGERSAAFVVSGELLLYRGRNHLVLTAFARTAGATDDSAMNTGASSDAAADPTATEAPPGIALDPSVADIIADLRRRRSADAGAAAADRFRQLDRTDPGSRAAADADTRLLPEGSFIAQRRGRLERTPDGDWLLVFDNDTDAFAAVPAPGQSAPGQPAQTADTAAKPLAPMVVLPSALLQRMEQIADIFGDTASVTVSGRVYTYNNTNHIRPTMFVTDRRGEINPLQ